MERVKQISVVLENRPGQLARLCRRLADREVNIIALSVAETSEQGVVRLVLDKPEEALRLLDEGGFAFVQTEVLLFALPNQPGALAGMTEKLTDKGVNIPFVYGSTGKGPAESFVVMGARNIEATERALADS